MIFEQDEFSGILWIPNQAMRKFITLLWLLSAVTAFAQPKRLVLQNIYVVDVEKGNILSKQTVAITGDRITTITKAASFKPAANDSVVDCTGQYLIPGLWDMHTHVWAPDYFFPLFIANGVTGIRGMFEQAVFAGQWREKGNTPGTLTPRGYYAGPILDGAKPIWPGSIGITDAARGRTVVDSLKNRLHVDFIKVYSLLEKDAYYAIADEAKKQQIDFAGHVPNKITLLEAARAGQKSQEHLYGFIELASDSSDYYYQLTEGKVKDSALNTRLARREFLRRTFSEKKLAAIIKELKQYNSWICPTMTVNRGIGYMNDPAFAKDPRMTFVAPMIKSMWDPKNDFRFKNAGDDYFNGERKDYELKKRIVRALNQGGIRLLAGTDTPNPYCFPGFSLHDELQLFTECGLSPLQALQTATLNPALYFGIQKDQGTVASGKVADLLVLKDNPLQDIGNTRKIGAVILKGRFIGAGEIDGMLQKARKLAGN
jgi:Amidohydrolase family